MSLNTYGTRHFSLSVAWRAGQTGFEQGINCQCRRQSVVLSYLFYCHPLDTFYVQIIRFTFEIDILCSKYNYSLCQTLIYEQQQQKMPECQEVPVWRNRVSNVRGLLCTDCGYVSGCSSAQSVFVCAQIQNLEVRIGQLIKERDDVKCNVSWNIMWDKDMFFSCGIPVLQFSCYCSTGIKFILPISVSQNRTARSCGRRNESPIWWEHRA